MTDDQDLLLNTTEYMPKTIQYIRNNGMNLENSFVATSICCPSRTEIITGRYFQNIRNDDESKNTCMHIDAQTNVINNTQNIFHMFYDNGYLYV